MVRSHFRTLLGSTVAVATLAVLVGACNSTNPAETGDAATNRDASVNPDAADRDGASGQDSGPGLDGGPAADGGDIDAGPLPTIQVWLVGDSTVAPNSGWGDSLQRYIIDQATVYNRGRSGRSSKSYYEEDDNYWSEHPDAVLNHLVAGDYVLIQFGHNDEKEEEYRHTDPGTAPEYQGTFRDYLELYIVETRARGATPILITPVSRMVFDTDGSHRRTHGNYPAATIKVAEDKAVVVLDLELRSHEIFDTLGQDQTMALYSDGVDRTHFPADKAWRVAKMVIDLLRESSSPLAAYIKPNQ
ncbi:MAG: rhamnogalacturonan acetylesterase [Deltaproteobacteria bacterium]|nr:rhamnogalacturonan acetylesterase [Deltaproteobacteria bacterium]